MQVSINYSVPAAELVDAGEIQVDVFKCPAWPHLVQALAGRTTYMHFPLMLGRDAVMNSESNAPADFDMIADLRAKTNTPFVNAHFGTLRSDYPEIPAESTTPEHIEHVLADSIRGVKALQARFGNAEVIIENVPGSDGRLLGICQLPEVITRLVEETGCGFLLDVSHARLAAEHMGMDEKEYMNQLPVQHIREVHVTGIDVIDDAKVALLESLGITESFYHQYKGRRIDHLPFTDADWEMLAWVFGHIHAEAWHRPEIVAFEYGGVGGFWEKVSNKGIIREQVPRLYDLVKNAVPMR